MKKINAMGIYFSPTEHTREVVQRLAVLLAEDAHLHDLTSYERGSLVRSFAPEDVIVVGVPVYGGRIPALASRAAAADQGQPNPGDCGGDLWQSGL